MTVCAKQFHACDNNEIVTKTETVLVQDIMHVNDSKCSKKSRKNTHTSENTKSDVNTTKDKLRPLTHE